MTLLLGILLGLGTAVVAWVLTQVFLSPRLVWSEGISKLPSPASPCGFQYRAKVKNVGWLRAVVDLRLQAYVVLKGLDPDRPSTWTRIRLPLSVEDVASLQTGATRLATIRVEELTPNMRRRLRDYGRGKIADDDSRTLEDLLALRPDSYLVLAALGCDGWTGAIHYRESPRYQESDIAEAYFKSGRSAWEWSVVWPRERLKRLRRRWRNWQHKQSLRRHPGMAFAHGRRMRRTQQRR